MTAAVLPLFTEADLEPQAPPPPERSGPRTINVQRLSRAELDFGRALYPDSGQHAKRPKTRAECRCTERPCPWVACIWHLYLDVDPVNGSIKLNHPDLEPWELEESCALDVAERDGLTLEDVGEILNLTREAVRRVEARGLAKLGTNGTRVALFEHW